MTAPDVMMRIVTLAAMWLMAGILHADTLLTASEYGLRPGKQDAVPAMRALLQQVRSRGGKECTIRMEPGEYHFYADEADTHRLFISNHDQQKEYRVGIALVEMEKLSLEARGCHFVFHGRILPVLVMDSREIKLNGFSISYATPFSAEGRIVKQSKHTTELEMNPDSQWNVENGKFHNVGEGWKDEIKVAIAFKEDGRMVPLGKEGDIVWASQATRINSGRVCFKQESQQLGLRIGDTLVLRSYWRPNPAMMLYRATNTWLRDIVFHDSMGMGLLAQRSKNISIRGGGCIRKKGRYGTTGADATHFSNCRGHIIVKNALYEGMMDDAINVHATSLSIAEVKSPTEIVAKYMHHQAIGFEVVQSGERVRFIHGSTLENNPHLVRVESATLQDERTLHLTLESPLPPGIGVGDALENADWHPKVSFIRNTVRHNRARGALFTTPKPVLVEHNRFLWSSGSAILLAGDAQGWYESGSCKDVIIRNNIFDHNLTSLFQFTDAIIAICPEVHKPDKQKTRYHRNICIENNTFRTHRVPLLSAISADNVVFRDNDIIYDDEAPSLFGGEPYRIQHCGEMDLQEVQMPE